MTSKTNNWKPLDFQCPYVCDYCPEKGHSPVPQLRGTWDQIPWDRLGVWVASDTDLFHPAVPTELIERILKRAREIYHCYIFCTKNPKRYLDFLGQFPSWTFFVTTVESDIDYYFSKAPPPLERLEWMKVLKKTLNENPDLRPVDYEINLDLQPIMDFTEEFLPKLLELAPNQIGIGRRVGDCELPEPSFRKTIYLAREMSKCLVLGNPISHQCMVNIDGCHVYHNNNDFVDWPPRKKLKDMEL